MCRRPGPNVRSARGHFWTGEHHRGGGELLAAAPLDRILVYVRAGSIVVTYPADHVGAGLGDTPESERPLEATLYGEAPLGSTGVRLADGTRIRWRGGKWSVIPKREVTFRHNPGKGGLNGRRADAAG